MHNVQNLWARVTDQNIPRVILCLWGNKTMFKDSIVEQVRRIREEHAARFGYDLKAIYEDLKDAERRSGRRLVSLPPKRVGEGQGERAERSG
jgi:hypothetical protein